MRPDDIEVHRTRNTPKCATVVLLDMSGSMRYDGLYIDVKRMGLALEGLIRREYPGDYLQFIEMYTFAKPRHISEIVALLPKPVTIFDPVVRLRADMSDPKISEFDVPPHFTNIQHGLQLARQFLAAQDTPNRQVILITDGLPTAHFEGQHLYLLYPPDPAHRGGHDARGHCWRTAKGSRSTSSCCPLGRSRARTCSSPTAWPNRRPDASSSPPARTWTATWSGTT